ncbi:hypothetical protein SDC9_168775 [bioreactor metagenome]|uniref:Uncharacterized protein n=1 Tax=bioreactor metagenome TaxID=1076179 RepID=A0A645G5J5_9ZZZZ
MLPQPLLKRRLRDLFWTRFYSNFTIRHQHETILAKGHEKKRIKKLFQFLHQTMRRVFLTNFAVAIQGKSPFARRLFFEGFVVFVELSHITKALADTTLQTSWLTRTFFLTCHKCSFFDQFRLRQIAILAYKDFFYRCENVFMRPKQRQLKIFPLVHPS